MRPDFYQKLALLKPFTYLLIYLLTLFNLYCFTGFVIKIMIVSRTSEPVAIVVMHHHTV